MNKLTMQYGKLKINLVLTDKLIITLVMLILL